MADFAELRNNVERVAELAHKPDMTEQEEDEATKTTILTAGLTLVGIYEELAGIRAALELRNSGQR